MRLRAGDGIVYAEYTLLGATPWTILTLIPTSNVETKTANGDIPHLEQKFHFGNCLEP